MQLREDRALTKGRRRILTSAADQPDGSRVQEPRTSLLGTEV